MLYRTKLDIYVRVLITGLREVVALNVASLTC